MTYEIQPAGALLKHGPSPFPFVRVAGKTAHALLARLRHAHPDTTPVIWGEEDQASRLFEFFDEPDLPSVESILESAAAADGNSAIAEHRRREEERTRALFADKGWDYPDAEGDDPADSGVVPPGTGPHDRLLGFDDYRTGQPVAEVLIGLIPTPRSYEVPAYLRFGGWNECPPPEIHVALARQWNERFGARLVVNTSDVMEFELERPVATIEEARELVPVLYSYCNDIIDQGVGSREALARTLHRGRFWYFWWD